MLSCEKSAKRVRRFYAFAVYTGLRAGEIRALDWSDVHEEEGFIHVHRAINRETGEVKATKTGLARKVPIEAALLPVLEAMRDEAGEGAVFPGMLARNTLPRVLRADLEAAGVKRRELFDATATTRRLDVHDLRHTYGTWRAIRGDDVIKIRFAMGHTDLQTTQRYINEAQASGARTARRSRRFPNRWRNVANQRYRNLTTRNHCGGAGNRTRVRKRFALCLYVRSRHIVSPRVAPTSGLSPALVTCLLLAARPVARRSASQT